MRLPAAAPILIEIRELKRLGLMRRISAVISSNQRRIASGELTLYA